MRGDHGEQHLRGADVAGRLLAADVLLAGLQREPVGRAPSASIADADQAAGQLPLEAGADREVAGVRAAEAHRHAEALGGADRRRRRRSRRAARSRVSASRSAATTTMAPRRVRGRDQRGVVADRAGGARVGQQHAEEVAVGQAARLQVGDDDLDAQRLGPGLRSRRWSAAACRRRPRTGSTWPCRPGGPASSPRRRRCASSSMDALATGSPVRSPTMVWKLSSASSRPCEISGWYGV